VRVQLGETVVDHSAESTGWVTVAE
jgi:hypothetical protein